MQGVDLVISAADLAPRLRVAANERLESVREHFTSQSSHFDDLGFRCDRPCLVQPLGRLRDVHRVISNSLEIVRNLQGRWEHAEVARHRLLQGQQIDALLLDLYFHCVDYPVSSYDPLRLLAIALEQGFHCQRQCGLCFTGHREQPHLHVTQLIVKMTMDIDAHPNLPVMYASVRSFLGLVKIRSVSLNSISSPRSKNQV